MKNGSFDIAFRTMTIGLVAFLVLCFASVGLNSLRSGSNADSLATADRSGSAESQRASEAERREFAASLARVSDRLAGIEQRFAEQTRFTPAIPASGDTQLQTAIASTHRRLGELGDRLSDRIQTIHVASEVELRDLGRQLTHLVDEQQQLQDQMTGVQIAAQNSPQPVRVAQLPPDVATAGADEPAISPQDQDRLTKNLEAMVTELASLREQLQAVRLAAIDPEEPRSRVERSREQPEPEQVDRTVPEPNDLEPSEETSGPETIRQPVNPTLVKPVEPVPVLPEESALPSDDLSSSTAMDDIDAALSILTDDVLPPTASEPQKTFLPEPAGLPGSESGEETVAAFKAETLPSVDAPALEEVIDPEAWTAPVAAMPVSAIVPASNSGSDSEAASIAAPAISLPAPETSGFSDSQADAPAPFPAVVADIVDPAPTGQGTAPSRSAATSAPRQITRSIPADAQRAPLALATTPAVRPFEVPTSKPQLEAQPVEAQPVEEEPEKGPFSLFSRGSRRSSSGAPNAKWRSARKQSSSKTEPALRDSRSLFPASDDKPSSSEPRETAVPAPSQDIPTAAIPLPLPGPQADLRPAASTADDASPVIEQTSATVPADARRFQVRATVLHITADDMTTIARAGTRPLAVMGGHEFRVGQVRQAVRATEAPTELYSGITEVTGGIPTRIPIGWLCPHCNDESGVENGDQLVLTLPTRKGERAFQYFVEQSDGTGRSESFDDGEWNLLPRTSVQITESAQDGTVETADTSNSSVLSRLPLIGSQFEKTKTERQIMQRIVVLTIREQRPDKQSPIIQLSGRQSSLGASGVVLASTTAPVKAAATSTSRFIPDSSKATATDRGLTNRPQAPAIEE